jgi:hypothetical protein
MGNEKLNWFFLKVSTLFGRPQSIFKGKKQTLDQILISFFQSLKMNTKVVV